MAIERAGIPCKRAAVFILFLFSAIVTSSSLSVAQVAPRWEVFGGYSYRRLNSTTMGFASNSNLNGWNGEGGFNITTTWGVVADLSGHYGSQLSAFDYMIGPQYSLRKDKSKFFGHVLFGKAQNTVNIKTSLRDGFKSVGRAFAAGGGYDLDLTPRFTVRFQADYVNTHTFGLTQNDIRVSTGLVFHFGHIGHRPRL
jgi:hypothetical protein